MHARRGGLILRARHAVAVCWSDHDRRGGRGRRTCAWRMNQRARRGQVGEVVALDQGATGPTWRHQGGERQVVEHTLGNEVEAPHGREHPGRDADAHDRWTECAALWDRAGDEHRALLARQRAADGVGTAPVGALLCDELAEDLFVGER